MTDTLIQLVTHTYCLTAGGLCSSLSRIERRPFSLAGNPCAVAPSIGLGIKVGNRGVSGHSVVPQDDRAGLPVGADLEVDSLGDVITASLRKQHH
jgi:hypothetical protein